MYIISRLNSRYACVAHGLNVPGNKFLVDTVTGSHKANKTSTKTNNGVELMQFHNGTMFGLVDGIGKIFPNLKSIFIGYSDSYSTSLNTKLIHRSNFENMENLFEIVIHKSDVEAMPEDTLWDLPNLERFQLDGKLNELSDRTFERNEKLKEVYLASNELEFLPRKLFANNFLLDWVNFKDNFLKVIEIDFIRLTSIKFIFLAGNVCINENFNKTAAQIEDQRKDQNESIDSDQIVNLQRLIYENCSSIP